MLAVAGGGLVRLGLAEGSVRGRVTLNLKSETLTDNTKP